MKYLYLGLALLALLILACCWSTQAVTARTEAVLLPLDCAAGAGIGGSDPVSAGRLEAAQAAWREGLPLLGCLVSHSYTAEISEELAELPLLEGAEFRRSCLRIREKLVRLRQMDRLTPENIF